MTPPENRITEKSCARQSINEEYPGIPDSSCSNSRAANTNLSNSESSNELAIDGCLAALASDSGFNHLLFRGGLHYSLEQGFLNPDKSSLFNILQEVQGKNSLLASPTGFEPVLPP